MRQCSQKKKLRRGMRKGRGKPYKLHVLEAKMEALKFKKRLTDNAKSFNG
jgi:hypothetical protein